MGILIAKDQKRKRWSLPLFQVRLKKLIPCIRSGNLPFFNEKNDHGPIRNPSSHGKKIDFFMDDNKYKTVPNEKKGPHNWPFDQAFYIILNIGIGGSWAGDSTNETVFPVVMEVDDVRFYSTIIKIF
ncbi:hypothetical protein JW935_25745 [candidate division KSB1 bacterium]|nr:hypothetical protein [candidate division KSB1 bacterium]